MWISGSKMEVVRRELRGKTRESRAEVAAVQAADEARAIGRQP